MTLTSYVNKLLILFVCQFVNKRGLMYVIGVKIK